MNPIKFAIINHSKSYIKALSSILLTDNDFSLSGSATNPYDAYHLICAKQPDLVLMDITIADFNSFYLIEKIKNTHSLQKIPKFIIVTASGNETIVSQAFHHDISYFILTPFDPKYALNRIKQILLTDSEAQPKPQKAETKEKVTNGIDYSVSNLLYKLGIPSSVKGYKYVKSALTKCTKDITLLDGITKQLYPEIAKEFKTTSTSVEHSIRNLVKNSCENTHTELFSILFGNNLQKNLTNSEFISTISNRLREFPTGTTSIKNSHT
ncbi:MAG: response regulator [Clostridia bacterium]|nr:response regulator [Clostridia bacterium]